jgi:hypothetical protein
MRTISGIIGTALAAVALLAAGDGPNNTGQDTPGERRDSLAASATSAAGAPGPRPAAVTVESDSPCL